jgi:hypothetical protein
VKGDNDMKRPFCGFVMLFLTTASVQVHAQNAYIGVVGGVNFADLDLEFMDKTITGYDIQSLALFGIGGFFGISVNEHLSIQLEPMYLQKGGLYTRPPGADMRLQSNQLELPLLLKAGIGEKVRPYILGGVFVSFVLKSSIEVEMAGRTWVGDPTEFLKKTEYGAVFGAGISFPVWKGSTFIEGRYALGLTNVNKGGSMNLTNGSLVLSGPQTDPRDEITTKGWQIMVGYQLPLGAE